MNTTYLALALYLKRHPILNEKDSFKICYLNILDDVVKRYSPNDELANELLKMYISELGVKDNYSRIISFDEKGIKKVSGIKLRNFGLITYRYALIADSLFIAAYYSANKQKDIIRDVLELSGKLYRNNISELADTMAKGELSEKLGKDFYKVKDIVESIKLNNQFLNQQQMKILVTATMSAGKSTLLNALIGKKVSLAKNESCTAKIHYIQNKAFEDGFDYEFDGFINLNASEDDLMQDAEENESTNIGVGTHFNSYYLDQKRLCFIDTPGVNSALDREHRVITNSVFTMEKFDRVVYVINAQNAGSNDDFTHLRFVEDKVDKDKVVFVLNKLDKFRAEDDSIEESIANIKKDLRDFGYKEPVICPVSAYAGELAKKVLFDFELNEYEKSDFDLLSRKLQSEDYNLYQYYDVNVKKAVKDLKVSGANASENKKAAFELLKASGILELEYILSN